MIPADALTVAIAITGSVGWLLWMRLAVANRRAVRASVRLAQTMERNLATKKARRPGRSAATTKGHETRRHKLADDRLAGEMVEL